MKACVFEKLLLILQKLRNLAANLCPYGLKNHLRFQYWEIFWIYTRKSQWKKLNNFYYSTMNAKARLNNECWIIMLFELDEYKYKCVADWITVSKDEGGICRGGYWRRGLMTAFRLNHPSNWRNPKSRAYIVK